MQAWPRRREYREKTCMLSYSLDEYSLQDIELIKDYNDRNTKCPFRGSAFLWFDQDTIRFSKQPEVLRVGSSFYNVSLQMGIRRISRKPSKIQQPRRKLIYRLIPRMKLINQPQVVIIPRVRHKQDRDISIVE